MALFRIGENGERIYSTPPANPELDSVAAFDGMTYEAALAEFQRRFIVRALHTFNYNVSLTAKALGISRFTIYRRSKLKFSRRMIPI